MTSTPPIHVGVLADSIGDGSGIDRYVSEIVRGLSERSEIELTIAVRPERVAAAREIAPSAGVVTIRGRGQIGRSLWELERLGRLLEEAGVDVVHGTKHVVPRTRLARVLTAHDVTLLTNAGQYPLAKRLLMPTVYRWSLRHADVVIAVSEATSRKLRAAEPRLRADVVVAPNGTSTAVTQAESRAVDLLDVTGRSFALVVGDLSPRKNIDLLLGIWDDVWAATGLVLVVVGSDGWQDGATRRRLADLVAQGRAARPGRVDDAELRWCYEHARILLYPSVEEGFGLPVAEAVALGTPVVASTDDAVVEAGAGAPVHLDPRDAAAWRSAIVELATSGGHRVPRPGTSWHESVDRTIDAYRRALHRREPRHS
jgi:glycosyltransferase involved in cell wall biosynthesis